MNPRVGPEKTRCRVGCGEESFFLDFFVTFFIKEKSKHTVLRLIKTINTCMFFDIKPCFVFI